MRNSADGVYPTLMRLLPPARNLGTGAWLAMSPSSRLCPTPTSTRLAFPVWRPRRALHSVEPPGCGPVCPVVWEARSREAPAYPDQLHVRHQASAR